MQQEIFTHYLQKGETKIKVKEPIGFDNFAVKLSRDLKTHGMSFEVSQISLSFFGNAIKIIRDDYEEFGVDAEMNYLVEVWSNETQSYESFYEGQLIFSHYQEETGNKNIIKIPIGQKGLQILLNNRIEQSVDLASNVGFDNNELPVYVNLSKDITLPGKGVKIISSSKCVSGTTLKDWNIGTTLKAFPKSSQAYEGLERFTDEALGGFFTSESEPYAPVIWRYVKNGLPENVIKPNTVFTLKGSLKCEITAQAFNQPQSVSVRISLFKKTSNNPNYLLGSDKISTDKPGIFDLEFKISKTIDDNDEYGVFIDMPSYRHIVALDIIECSFEVSAIDERPSSRAKVSMLHEALSRVTEIITDGKLTVDSPIYCREDSEVNAGPYGVGSMRCITNGLQIRNAKLPTGQSPTLFTNMKLLLQSLSAIDNIGYGVVGNKLIIDTWRAFYKNDVIIEFNNIAIVRESFHEQCFASLKVGYNKWGADSINGIDSVHTEREYRTSIKSLSNKQELKSNFIADGYSIEETRRKVDDAEVSDWKYDNDIFILELNIPNSDGKYEVKTSMSDTGDTMITPNTMFNPEITPARNALRWLSRMLQGVKKDKKLLFNSGTGNYKAKGRNTNYGNKITDIIIEENQDLTPDIIGSKIEAIPVFLSEKITFDAPLKISDFIKLRRNPYSIISINNIKAFILSVDYKITLGKASFNCIPAVDYTITEEAQERGAAFEQVYSCDGTFAVKYMWRRKVHSYNDGSVFYGEWVRGEQTQRQQIDGQCGYNPPPKKYTIEWQVRGYDTSYVGLVVRYPNTSGEIVETNEDTGLVETISDGWISIRAGRAGTQASIAELALDGILTNTFGPDLPLLVECGAEISGKEKLTVGLFFSDYLE